MRLRLRTETILL